MKWIIKMIDRAFAVIGAFAFAQFPQFYSQYLHELAGHVEELTRQVNLLKQSAQASGKTVQELIIKFLQFSDSDVVRQGEFMKQMVERLENLALSQNRLQEASVFTKPLLFIREADGSIALETYHRFLFGFTFTWEGLVYALIGLVVGYFFFWGIFLILKGIGSLFRRKPKANLGSNPGPHGEPG